MVVRGGYGIYYDTSVYQPIAMQMAQQAPLSKSLRIANTPETPLTLANGFVAPASTTQSTTFGVDPGFRVGYSQNWQLSIQRDLPAGLQLVANYNGGKGTRAQQQFLPNTFPSGSIDPAGFTYLTSNGNSIRHAGQAQLRRRLRNGLTASLQYTYSKSIDNATLGGRSNGSSLIAQNWQDLSAERARSNFDQRHLLNATFQYTTSARSASSRNGPSAPRSPLAADSRSPLSTSPTWKEPALLAVSGRTTPERRSTMRLRDFSSTRPPSLRLRKASGETRAATPSTARRSSR